MHHPDKKLAAEKCGGAQERGGDIRLLFMGGGFGWLIFESK
jgi:hypothetical protein